jgi:hypothetical protein
MIRTFLAVCLALAAAAVPAHAQQQQPRAVSGTWRVDFVTPLGQNWIIMTINQSGTRLTGHATDEFGEYEISGRVVDDQVTVVWSVACPPCRLRRPGGRTLSRLFGRHVIITALMSLSCGCSMPS